MCTDPVVLPADSPRRADLEAVGWTVAFRSWGAGLDADDVDPDALGRLVRRPGEGITVRELGPDDVEDVLALDSATAEDYPGGAATRHDPLDHSRAEPTDRRRAFGALTAAGELAAMTFVDIDRQHAETDFTVVRRDWRGRGLGAAVKAASVLALVGDGTRTLRTGGSADNPASIATNTAVGYTIDEQWVTLVAPGR